VGLRVCIGSCEQKRHRSESSSKSSLRCEKANLAATMTREEMAAFLFVSPAHVRMLLAGGELLVACGSVVDAFCD
jgi:hypothetical protein